MSLNPEDQKPENQNQPPEAAPGTTPQTQNPAETPDPASSVKPEQTPPMNAAAQNLEEEEKVIPLSELKEDVEYEPEESAFMSKLYEDTMREIKSGEIVTGKIISISEKDVAIDIGFKSEGTVPIEEFDDPSSLNIGDTIEVFLENIEDQEGELVLSKKRADFARVWSTILDFYQRGETVRGKCLRRIKGGIVVDVMGVEAFLPGSQIDIHPVRDFDSWINETADFRIVKVNELRKNIVLSRKVLIEENLRDVREKILSEIQIGQTMEGVVKNITDFGAFVDLGGVDGLLHITDLSWGRVNHPSEIVSYDQRLKVCVLDFDPVRKRISIGLKQLQPHPWEGIEQRYPLNSKVTGKVVSITKYGAFVELEEGIEGLIHISEMSWTQHIKHPAQLLNIGQEVEVVVLSIDAENRKISLGLKQTEEDPWERLEEKYAVGTKHTGTVRDLVPFGAFVELEEGIEGLVHISDLSWTKKIKHPGEVVKKGDSIEVVILSFDRNERRIALGHKQTLENPWEQFAANYSVGSIVDGKIVRTVDKGAIVELPLMLEGFLPVSQFGKDPKTGRGKALKEGEELKLEVLEFDKENKKIILSAASVQKREEESEYQAYLQQQEGAVPAEEAVQKTEASEQQPLEAAAAPPEIGTETEAEKPKKKPRAAKKAPRATAEEAPAETEAGTVEAAAQTEGEEEEKPTQPRKTKKSGKKESASEDPEDAQKQDEEKNED
jgi:small subunit ribosomal protein S1